MGNSTLTVNRKVVIVAILFISCGTKAPTPKTISLEPIKPTKKSKTASLVPIKTTKKPTPKPAPKPTPKPTPRICWKRFNACYKKGGMRMLAKCMKELAKCLLWEEQLPTYCHLHRYRNCV